MTILKKTPKEIVELGMTDPRLSIPSDLGVNISAPNDPKDLAAATKSRNEDDLVNSPDRKSSDSVPASDKNVALNHKPVTPEMQNS